ncbi:hypothetical protein PABG_00675 [Paracoccidioides brasiliensis Pb03]|nr:hypothetical protein PABG_00675 [Paracoccidioides brasiliensis Pb03]
MIEFLYTLQYSTASESYVEASVAETAPDNGKLATKQPQPEQVVCKTANTRKNKKAAYTEHSTSSKQASDNSPSHWDLISLHIRMYALGDRLMIEGLKSHAKEFIPEHDCGLKRLVVAIAAKNLRDLRHATQESKHVLTDEFLKTVPAFMSDLLVVLMHQKL